MDRAELDSTTLDLQVGTPLAWTMASDVNFYKPWTRFALTFCFYVKRGPGPGQCLRLMENARDARDARERPDIIFLVL